jgi:hypothetical protein
MGKMHLYQYLYIRRRLTELEVRQLCGWLVHGKRQGEHLLPQEYVEPIEEGSIKRMVLPNAPVIKMMKREFVDDFFNHGTIQLGSFEYFKHICHDQIGDGDEGMVVAIADGEGSTAAGKFAGGFDNYVFCAFAGPPTDKVRNQFGYDSGFLITNPEGFVREIADALDAIGSEYAECVYAPQRAIRSSIAVDFQPGRIDHNLIELVSSARNFIKADRYKDQREFRFTWRVSHDVSHPLILHCPQARVHCERIEGW